MNKQAYYKIMKMASLLKAAADKEETKQEPGKKEQRKSNKKEEKLQNKMILKLTSSERKRTGKLYSEGWGGLLTSPAILATLGAILGGTYGAVKKPGEGSSRLFDILEGAAIGGAGGAGLGAASTAIGAFSGFLAGPRSLQRQNKYDASKGQTVANYLIPGVAGFNAARGLSTMDELRAMLREYLLDQAKKKKGLV